MPSQPMPSQIAAAANRAGAAAVRALRQKTNKTAAERAAVAALNRALEASQEASP